MAEVRERSFVLIDIEGQPIALFAAASISQQQKVMRIIHRLKTILS